MPLDPNLKDSKNYQLVAGIDEDREAQELTFVADAVKVNLVTNEIITLLRENIEMIRDFSDQILTELKVMNLHLSTITDNKIECGDVE